MAKLKDTLIDAVGRLVERIVPAKGSKASIHLTAIFVWQEISSYTDKKLKEAWVLAQEAGVLPGDDDMREKGRGEHIIADSDRFSCVATVTKPRETFDQELFIGEVAKKYKLKVSELKALAERCKKEGKAPLSKRVLEA